jgi:predicted molibdopterin-dependent oxidoreductase YjgC
MQATIKTGEKGMISVTINGQSLQVSENLTVLQVAQQAGITIPTLCYHKDLTPFGGCRLCVVEVQGARLPATSCTMPVSRGMVVQTESPKITRYRRAVLELLLSKYYDAGYTRSNGKTGLSLDTQFVHWLNYYGIDIEKGMASKPMYQVDSDPNAFVWVDMNKCVQCTRCIRACAEVQGRFVWGLAYRGPEINVVPGTNTTMLQARCESCGACVAYCPTGALDNKMSVSLGPPDRLVRTTCAYCAVGCQFDLNVKDEVQGGRVIRVTSDPNALVNGMHLCVKGRYGYEFIHTPNRLRRPRVREYLLEKAPHPKDRGKWVEVDWDVALDITAEALRAVRDRNGPEAIGFITSGRGLNEENYLMNKFARQVIGCNNIDCAAHLHHDSVVEGLDTSLGLHAQSGLLEDIARYARSILIIGSNITEQHPVFGAKIRQAVLRRKAKLVVAHPDFINISEYAALRLVHKYGTEVALINGLIHAILQNGWEDREFIAKHTEAFKAFKRTAMQFDLPDIMESTGVKVDTLYQAAEILTHNRPMSIIWGSDLAQPGRGRSNVTNLVNLQLLVGDMFVKGGGLIPLRSQNNSQGASDMGALPDTLPGYQSVESRQVRSKFEQAWGIPLPGKAGLSASEMIASAAAKELNALYILGEDLVGAASNGPAVRRSVNACDLVILQDPFITETSQYADVHLPGVTFAEKTGTFTNTERRVQMVHQAIAPQFEAKPDIQIIIELARRFLPGLSIVNGEYAGWDYDEPASIMSEIAALTPGYNKVSYDHLEQAARLDWSVMRIGEVASEWVFIDEEFPERGKFTPIQLQEEAAGSS